jgi:hypothetical protein
LAGALTASCASDGPERPTASRDAVLDAPAAHVPEGVQAVRNDLASQRASTLSQMDVKSGNATQSAASSGAPWYGGVFDVLDFAASFGGLWW